MNPPVIVFYVTPRDVAFKLQVYNPPENECSIIRAVHSKGYNYNVSESIFSTKSLKSLQSCLVVTSYGIEKEGEKIHVLGILKKEWYNGEKVFALIYWQKALSDRELDFAQKYFNDLFGVLDSRKSVTTRSMSRMLGEKGFIDPPVRPQYLGGSFEEGEGGGNGAMDCSA